MTHIINGVILPTENYNNLRYAGAAVHVVRQPRQQITIYDATSDEGVAPFHIYTFIAARDADEGPQKKFTVSSFWMGVYEVTHDEFDIFFKDSGKG